MKIIQPMYHKGHPVHNKRHMESIHRIEASLRTNGITVQEVHNLKNRFDSWKTSFKQRMQQTYVLVKHQGKQRPRTRITGPVHEAIEPSCSPRDFDGLYSPMDSPRSDHAHPFALSSPRSFHSDSGQKRLVDTMKDGFSGAGRMVSKFKGRVHTHMSDTLGHILSRHHSLPSRSQQPSS